LTCTLGNGPERTLLSRVHAPLLEGVLAAAKDVVPSFTRFWGPKAPPSLQHLLDAYDHAEEFLTNCPPPPSGRDRAAATRLLRELLLEKESLLNRFPDDPRHDFFIVIPVAERPTMLANCLQSLRQHLKEFPYGREWLQSPTGGVRDKLTVVVVDDSEDPANMARHRNLSEGLHEQGLRSEYFGLEEQKEVLGRLSADQRDGLCRILGSLSGPSLPGHKGASASRNLACLYLARQLAEASHPERTLIWFVDSDEEFKTVADNGRGREVPFFHAIDRVFRRNPIEILTGKVFGDPPVAPAVMVGGLLEDMESLFQNILTMNPAAPCPFHRETDAPVHSAAYNDLRILFGFSDPTGPVPFPCPLSERHDSAAALKAFIEVLPAFFHGRHPTRPVSPDEVSGNLTPARTVYTGNYVLRPAGLRHFIPFAPLRLRMAGPVLGRLLRNRLQNRFVSGPFPLLHRRVLPGQAESEFRAGIKGSGIGLSLAREFEAQFWGDVVLFAVESLAEQGYPETQPSREVISGTLQETAKQLMERYEEVRKTVTERANRLLALFHSAGPLWTREPELERLIEVAKDVVLAVEAGLSEKTSHFSRETPPDRNLETLAKFIEAYREDEEAWHSVLKALEAER